MLTPENMTVEQKIGHVMCACFVYHHDGDLEFALELIKKRALTCVRLSANKRFPEIMKALREAADYPLLIITDMEQGFTPAKRQAIPFLTLAACDNPEYTRAFAAATASDAKSAGYSGCWGPVIDILEGDGPCSVSRKAGDTPERVTKLARDIASVYASYNFQSTGKHYPGGRYDIAADTHMVEGVCSKTKEELIEFDLQPYLALWREGLLPTIMTRHCVYPNIDPVYPASLSKKVIGIIRELGYDGLIYTDSMAMMGIMQKYGEAESMALALEAGNDIIMPNCRRSNRELFDMMMDCYERGLITDERLDEAVRRVLETAEKFAAEPTSPYPVPENITEILDSIARDSVTAVCDDGVEVAVPVDKRRIFVVMTDMGYDGLSQEIASGKWYSPSRVIRAINERFPSAEVVTLSEYPDAKDNERVLNAVTEYDEAIYVSFCTTGAYLGTDCLTRRSEAVINSLIYSGKCDTVVHFGNPLALKNLYHIKRKIFGYMAPEAQIYAFDALAGIIPAKGKLPFPEVFEKEYKN